MPTPPSALPGAQDADVAASRRYTLPWGTTHGARPLCSRLTASAMQSGSGHTSASATMRTGACACREARSMALALHQGSAASITPRWTARPS